MANWSDLKSAVASIIKTNGAQQITGQLLQNVLNNIISNVGLNSTFAGIATPETNPGTPDGNVFYLATIAGTYSNFNGIIIEAGEAVILEWKGSWTKKTSGFATQEKLSELASKWAVNSSALSKSKIVNYIVDAYAEVDNVVTNVSLYNLRYDGSKAYISIRLNYGNSFGSTDSQSLELPLHEEYTWETVTFDFGGTICNLYLLYSTKGMPTSTISESVEFKLRKVNIIKNRYIDYESPDFSLLHSASLPAGFIKSIYKKTKIESLSITRYRNTSEKGLYVGFLVNGVSRVFTSEYTNSEVIIDLKEFTCVIDASLMGGDQYLTIPLKPEVIPYNDLKEGVKDVIDSIQPIHNDLKLNGIEKLPSGSSVTGSYGGDNAIYTIPLPEYKKLHLYVEYRLNDIPKSEYANMLTIGGSNKIQITRRTYKCNKIGMIYPDIYFGANYSSIIINAEKNKTYIGESSFFMRFTGDCDDSANQDIVCLISEGTCCIKHKTDDDVIESVTFNDTDSVYSLVNKINSMANIECVGIMTAGKTCAELVQDVVIPLVSQFNKDDGSGAYWDAPKMYVPYLRDSSKHSIELIIDYENNLLAAAFDGLTYVGEVKAITENKMIIGDSSLPITFENLHVDIDSFGDAELITNTQPHYADNMQLISNHNPKLIIWEGHGVDNCMDEDAPLTNDMAASTDRLFRVFEELGKKGYVPVTWDDIIDWKLNNKLLPKRCYNIMMDDFRVTNFVDYENRKPFNRYNVKTGLAIIETFDRNETVEVNGESYTKGECVDICIKNGWKLASHAKHNRLGSVKISELPNLLRDCAISCDKVGITPDILIYPYGSYQNTNAALSNSAFKLGVMTTIQEYNCKGSNDFYLGRYEIGVRESLDNVLMTIK